MLDEQGLYVFEDISFINTDVLQETAKLFTKQNDNYCLAPKDSDEWIDFWEIEEKKRLEGTTIFGRLTKNGIKEVHITGEHYGFLNFAHIHRTVDEDTKDELIKLTKGQKRAGKKKSTFPDFYDGHYHYMKSKEFALDYGKNVVVAKARRKGFSYMEGWDAADSINLHEDKTVLLTAFDTAYLTDGDQIMSMTTKYLDFLESKTGFERGYLRKTIDFVKLGYREQNSVIDKGYQSKVIATSFGPSNPDAAIGKDAYKIKVEEAGKAPNLEDFMEVTLSTMEDGDLQTGSLIIFGTGGTKEANWETFEKYFYNPNSINALAFRNIWDENAYNDPDGCSFFYPQELNYRPFIDEHGNSLLEEAIEVFEKKSEEQRKKAKSSSDYARWRGQRARRPSEAFASAGMSILPDVSDQVQRVKHDITFKNLGRKGIIKIINGQLTFIDNEHLNVNERHEYINKFPLDTKQDVEGCIWFWQEPYRDRNGKIPKGLYRLWNDPYGTDKDTEHIKMTDSLGVTYIYEVMNNFTPTRGDILIGGYIGRPERQETYNLNLAYLTAYVNGILTVENDRGDDVKRTFRELGMYDDYLSDEPDFKFNESLGKKHGREKGISMANPRRQTHALLQFRDWLITIRGLDDYGKPIYNYHTIPDLGLLQEIEKHKKKGNFDRISSNLIGMLDIQELEYKMLSDSLPTNENKENYYTALANHFNNIKAA